jgi:type II secretory pathway pseudopilin PulG
MTLAEQPAIVDINLLPAGQRPTEISGRAVAIAAIFALAIAGLAPVALYAQSVEDSAQAAERRAGDADQMLRALQIDLAQQRAIRIETEQAKTAAGTLRETRSALQQGSRALHEDLTKLWGAVPDGTSMTRVAGGATTFQVEGEAASPLAAIAYAGALEDPGGFPRARLASFTPAGDTGAFVIDVQR